MASRWETPPPKPASRLARWLVVVILALVTVLLAIAIVSALYAGGISAPTS
jgi:hypothetical protein